MANGLKSLLVVVAMLAIASPAFAALPNYSGERLPATASVFVPREGGGIPNSLYLGFVLDVDGDGLADVQDTYPRLSTKTEGIERLFGAYVSPTDPDVVYLYYDQQNGPGLAVKVLRHIANGWEPVGSPIRIPDELGEYTVSVENEVWRRDSFLTFPEQLHSWTGCVTSVRLENGTDALLFVATRADSQTDGRSRFALLVDGDDSDGLADRWSSVEEIPGAEVFALSADGAGLARTFGPARLRTSTTFERLLARDDDENGQIETPRDVDSAAVILAGPAGTYASGWGDVDSGMDRVFFGNLLTGHFDLDSAGRPRTGSSLSLEFLPPLHFLDYITMQLFATPSGMPVAFGSLHTIPGSPAVVWFHDANFDGLVANDFNGPSEVATVFTPDLIDSRQLTSSFSITRLGRVATANGGAALTFRDFGVYPDDRGFTCRFGGVDHDRVWVSEKGLVSFVGPVGGPSSSAALEELRGVVAPAWSDSWDTSQVQIFAGYAPADRSFRDVEGVLAFSIEWRGLRDPSWEDGRRFSMRLLLFSDGTFRTDFGAIDEATTPFVTGYSGAGLATSSLDVDVSGHSYGTLPAGSGAERFAVEAFGGSNDLGHIPVRWLGYPERVDSPAPAPIINNARLRNGKLSLDASGSNIVSGARLVVDGVEAFGLTRNAAGTKWVVRKSVRSFPGGRKIAEALAGGGHEVVVVNPDGAFSAASSL